ncbi:MAG: glycosyltransferase [Fervidobacterium sp.]
METLKISFLSYMGRYATPPFSYGGEIIYWNIVDELAKMGHHVTLYASPGSKCPLNGKLVQMTSIDENGSLNSSKELYNVSLHLKDILSSDIIHDGSNFKLTHYYANTLGHKNSLAHLISVDQHNLFYPHHVVLISRKHLETVKSCFSAYVQEPIPHPIKSPSNMFMSIINPLYVYPDIDLDFFEPCYEKEDYFVWVSRFHPVKGVLMAVDICKKAGVKLKVGGDISSAEHLNYFMKIQPILEKNNVEFVPTPDRMSLKRLLQHAKAFIFPVQYVEAFGLIVLESLALGTPVITSCNGAPSEIIEHGKSGFVSPLSVEAFVERVQMIDELKPEDARRRAEQFKKGTAAQHFYRIYKMMLDGKWPTLLLPTKHKTSL